MKQLFVLLLCIVYGGFQTTAQEIKPIYGLALCMDNQSISQKRNYIQPNSISYVPVNSDSSLRAFLPRFEEGISAFINGDPTLWKQHVSRREDVTIMGGFGAYEKGWQQVGPRYDWAAARFLPSGAKVQVEYLSLAESGEIGYTISIERSQVRFADTNKVGPMALRVTHLFRREGGEWKLVHRHADHVMEKTTVLKK